MIVPDASVLVNAVGDAGGPGAAARHLLQATTVAIPDVADLETAAVLRKRWIARSLDDRELRTALQALSALPFPRYPARAFLGRVYELRANLSPYDAIYMALAEALDAELVTADGRLVAAPGIRCRVRLVSPD